MSQPIGGYSYDVPAGIGITLHGADEAIRKLRDLEYNGVRRAVTKAVRAGINEVLKLAKNMAPNDTGALRRQLRSSVGRDRKSLMIRGRIRCKRTKSEWRKRGQKGNRNAGKYLHLVVAGTRPHSIPKITDEDRVRLIFGNIVVSRVDHPGAKPQPFLEKAAILGMGRAVKTFSARLAAEVDKETAKLRAQK